MSGHKKDDEDDCEKGQQQKKTRPKKGPGKLLFVKHFVPPFYCRRILYGRAPRRNVSLAAGTMCVAASLGTIGKLFSQICVY